MSVACGHCSTFEQKTYHATVALVRECSTRRYAAKAATPAPAPRRQSDAEKYANVAEGGYAIRVDSTVCFYKVNRPSTGKWAGYVFVSRQAGDDLYPIKGSLRHNVLTILAADPEEASLLYGRELGKCGDCGRTLTTEESRARGRGPVCDGRRK